ncbi:hypothetical protein L202_03314 [Cryptococcus amylolentus CBS 6039]|uniref:UFD1-domain-containing protein n=1 Tax=Cryptococcus amylolentus CBS 6039 TaxID=1295533 RepID=A0A1E3HSL0_9TREE|nr:hypothetical protein L202_03314 [Cryptococcus amylolentus CBS 6039]ODN79302.1 hypothetical protein L202_03314 [Cryptococcus amylolentus CBS 6039]
MNHGYDSDEDYDDYAAPPQIPTHGGPGGIFQHLMAGLGGGMQGFGHAAPSAYDDYFKAYSVAMMNGRRERPELLYGGKIIMPPSALAKLSALDLPSPWTFQLRNPKSPTTHTTHAGVLEFIAEEGIVHLPAWMMQTLNLEEGDPIRLTGAILPKGKMVKIQAQSTMFLEVADPKAVLESALRSYSVLSPNDIIEITYNSLTFEFLIMEVTPAGPGISVIDTDLEVDFATPKGYVEPPRPEPKPVPTMAEKLNINLSETHSAGASRPGTSMSHRTGGSGGQTPLESFTGVGQSLSGKKVKGRGLARKIEEVDPSSKINRNEYVHSLYVWVDLTYEIAALRSSLPKRLQTPTESSPLPSPSLPANSSSASSTPLTTPPKRPKSPLPLPSPPNHSVGPATNSRVGKPLEIRERAKRRRRKKKRRRRSRTHGPSWVEETLSKRRRRLRRSRSSSRPGRKLLMRQCWMRMISCMKERKMRMKMQGLDGRGMM